MPNPGLASPDTLAFRLSDLSQLNSSSVPNDLDSRPATSDPIFILSPPPQSAKVKQGLLKKADALHLAAGPHIASSSDQRQESDFQEVQAESRETVKDAIRAVYRLWQLTGRSQGWGANQFLEIVREAVEGPVL